LQRRAGYTKQNKISHIMKKILFILLALFTINCADRQDEPVQQPVVGQPFSELLEGTTWKTYNGQNPETSATFYKGTIGVNLKGVKYPTGTVYKITNGEIQEYFMKIDGKEVKVIIERSFYYPSSTHRRIFTFIGFTATPEKFEMQKP